jgi:hypothetical protein
VGISCSKMFDSAISECYIRGYGIGIYADGCDINKINHNRFGYNARHIHVFVFVN